LWLGTFAMLPPRVAQKLEDLEGSLTSPNVSTRVRAVDVIAYLKEYARPALLRALEDEAPAVRLRAAAAFERFDPALAIEAAAKELDSPYHLVRIEALEILSTCGDMALPHLIKALQDKHSDVRRKAAGALKQSYDYSSSREKGKGPGPYEQAVPHLVAALRDESEPVRTAAKSALAFIKGVKFVDIIGQSVNINEINTLATMVDSPRQASPDHPAERAEPTNPAEALQALAATLPGDYPERAAALANATDAYRLELAAQLAPAFNAHIRAMPHGTYEEKKALARWVNDELRRFDLAIKCPKTGMPSILVADPGNHTAIGRFQLMHRNTEGKQVRSLSTPELLPLELITAPPRREAIREWQDRIGQQRGGASRP
jgi:hypothetical protein